jgi:hypothetical protein
MCEPDSTLTDVDSTLTDVDSMLTDIDPISLANGSEMPDKGSTDKKRKHM